MTTPPAAAVEFDPAIYATVAVRDPQRGTLLDCRLKSNDFSADTKDRYEAPHREGDYVTAVYLPGRPVNSRSRPGVR